MRSLILLVYTLIAATSFSQKADTIINQNIDPIDLQGNWEFTYAEAFDWSDLGIPSDSLEVQYFLLINNGQFTETMDPNDSGFVRNGNYKFEKMTNTLQMKVISQTSNDSEANQNAKGMKIYLKILKVDSENMELIYTLPDNKDKESSLNGFGKCRLIKRL